MTVPVVFANLPTGENPLALFDEMFAYVIGLIQSGSSGFQPTVVDDSVIPVDATTQALVIKRTVAGDTSVLLPPVAQRNGVGLYVADWNGNAQDITVTPNGSETIMGLSSAIFSSNAQGAGTAAAFHLLPSTELNGWYVG